MDNSTKQFSYRKIVSVLEPYVIVGKYKLKCACTFYMLTIYVQQCCGIKFIELPGLNEDEKNETLGKIEDENKYYYNVPVEAGYQINSFYARRLPEKELDVKVSKGDYNKQFNIKKSTTKSEEFNEEASTVNEENKYRTTQVFEKLNEKEGRVESEKEILRVYPPVRAQTKGWRQNDGRRSWLVTPKNSEQGEHSPPLGFTESDKDSNLKNKIATLVEQTMHDTEYKIKSIQHFKEENKNQGPYRIGFILSMIKKSRDVLNELFNVAVKHRTEWRALEQLKIFELIVHTNVDTTNLVRQLVEIHIQHLNETKPGAAEEKPGGEAELNKHKKVLLL